MDGDADLAGTDLVDILKRRRIKTVLYFHTDHFEPWSLGLNEKTARGVERMRKMSRASPFARKLSLFYCPFVPYSLDVEMAYGAAGRGSPGDAVYFGARSAEQERLARDVIRPLVAEDQHEMHLHVHHEFWTRNESDFDSPVSRWVNAHSTAEMDKNRLDFGFHRFKEAIAAEIGDSFDRWAFIHGNWALAASDPLICTIENELGMIMRHGGFGDFSFPAGRGYCDPRLEAPFTCLPIEGKRVYDDPASDPRMVRAGSGALRPDRFFIWNSPIKATYSSLDYYSEPNRELFKEPDRVIAEWLSSSVSLDGHLFVKTHAHSMKWEYRIHEPDALTPHRFPGVIKLFERLSHVCDRANVELRCVTVNEVMEWLHALDSRRPSVAEPDSQTVVEAAGGTLDAMIALDRELTAKLRDWVHADQERVASAGAFYHNLLHRDHILQDYERRVLEYIVDKLPPDQTRIVEVGVGYGMLSLLLAAMGYEVIAFEGDALRFAGLRFLADSVSDRFDGIGARLKPTCDWFPDAFDPSLLENGKRNLLLTTNLVNSAAVDRQDLILDVATRFDDLIIDTTRFGVARYEAGAAEEFRGKVAAGYRKGVSVWRRAPNEIWHFLEPVERREPPVKLPPVAKGANPLNAEIVALHESWMTGEGLANLPDDLYAAKLSRRVALESYEVAIATALAARFDRDTTVVEIGSGYGALALMLARNGFVVRGVEGDRRRSAAFAWHLQRYLDAHPELAGRVDCTAGFFPEVDLADLAGRSGKVVCIATNITHSYTATHHAAILEAIRGFDELVIDLSRFGVPRDTQAERDALRDELVGRGFEPVERLHFAAPYEYWRFRVKPATDGVPVASAPGAQTETPTPAAPAVPPLLVKGRSGVLFSAHGNRHLDACPVCRSRDIVALWRIPMSSLDDPTGLDSDYFSPLPSLRVPGRILCYDFCRECECVFVNPVPDSRKEERRRSDHQVRALYRDPPWHGYEETYDRVEKWFPDGATVLVDAVCGAGQFLEVARKRSPEQWRRLIGLDMSEAYVAHMRTRDMDAHAVDLDTDEVDRIVAPHSVDFVMFREPFRSAERPMDGLAKLLATLRPGGRLCLAARRYGKDVQAVLHPDERVYFGETTIADLPERLGCRMIDVSISGAFYHVILEK